MCVHAVYVDRVRTLEQEEQAAVADMGSGKQPRALLKSSKYSLLSHLPKE